MNIEKKLTAMQELMNSFDDYQKESQNDSITISKLKEVIEKEYLEKEKQNIIDAYDVGYSVGMYETGLDTGKQYFEETFKK